MLTNLSKYVYLFSQAPGQKFKFPDLTLEKEEKEKSEIKKYEEQVSEGFKQFDRKNKSRPGLPGWFSI